VLAAQPADGVFRPFRGVVARESGPRSFSSSWCFRVVARIRVEAGDPALGSKKRARAPARKDPRRFETVEGFPR